MQPDPQTEALRDGTVLQVDVATPPLRPEERVEFISHVARLLDEPFLPEILSGRWNDDADFRVFRGRVDGRLAVTGWLGIGRRMPRFGVVAGVVTAACDRRKGAATALCERLWTEFAALSDGPLFLSAASSTATRIYERLGFKTIAGRLMFRSPVDQAWDAGFASTGPVVERAADRGDMGAIVAVKPQIVVLADITGLRHLPGLPGAAAHLCEF